MTPDNEEKIEAAPGEEIPLPGVLPDLPPTVVRDLEKTWLLLLDRYSLTNEHIQNREDERARFRRSAAALRDSSRSVSGSWQIDHQFADSLGVAASCSFVTAWFSSLAVAYWGLPYAATRNLFPTWTESMQGRVLSDLASIWSTNTDDTQSGW